ncbi:MAG TPA: glycerophosphodiester phosphodiesterase family protein [Candidatus Limnocylindria bacterium]|nr:glycerophosphodiester phosphodiesterase family protein [Candidatus Limnocylindria bacterium]
MTGKVSVTAHRGASAHAPENTMAAFRLAAEAGADLIEFDVHLTADDELVVIHDDALDRTTDGTGAVRERTLAEIRALDASHGDARHPGERVPTLEEVVTWAMGTALGLSVEIKQPSPIGGRPRYPLVEERVLDLLRAHGALARSLIHSFDHATVRRVRELEPGVATGVTFGSGSFVDPLAPARAADASGIHPSWSWLTPEICRSAHDAGMHVSAWGLRDPLDAERVGPIVRAGVDLLTVDDPGALRRILASNV